MQNGKSWKTTAGGIGMILASLSAIIAMLTGHAEFSVTGITAAIGGITGGIALINAKDNNVTGAGSSSETVTK